MREGLLMCGGLLLVAACAGRADTSNANSAGAANSAGSYGTAGAGAGGAAPMACALDAPSAAQLAATPRANTNLELLALKFSSGVVAEQAIYDRLVRDVSLIVAQDQSVADISYFPPHDGKQLLLRTDARTVGAMETGSYGAWKCLNDTYGIEDVSFNSGTISYALLTLKGIYDLRRLAMDYAALQAIYSAEPNISGGDGPTICVTRKDDTWHYVFDRAGGDCPAGCTEHEYHHFTVSKSGTVTALGALTDAERAIYATREVCH